MTKGTFTAAQALRPTELKVGDILSTHIDNLIKNQRAEQAAKLKALAERKASIDDYYKSIKIEPKEVDKYISDANYKITSEITDKIGQYRLMAQNAKTDYEANKYMAASKKLADQYRFLQTELGGSQFLNDLQKVREYVASGDAFDDSEQIRLAKAYEANLWRMATDDDGNIRIYAKTGTNLDDPEKEYSLTELKAIATGRAQVDMLEDTKTRGKGLYSEMQSRAKLLTEEWTTNPTGDRLKSAKEFVAEKAGIDFDTKYGAFNANRPVNSSDDLTSLEYGQFAIKTIGNIPQNEEDHNRVRQAYIQKMSTFAPTKTKDINEVSDYQRQKDDREFLLKVMKANQPRVTVNNGGGNSGGGGGFSSVTDSMISKQDKVVVQIPDVKTGGVKGVQLWAANTVPLPKVKGYPATNNTFGLAMFKNKAGQVVPTIIMGAPADNGRLVYSKISASDFTGYVSKAGYDPMSVLNQLSKNNNSWNRYTGLVDTTKPIYNKVKVGHQAKEIKEGGDSTFD